MDERAASLSVFTSLGVRASLLRRQHPRLCPLRPRLCRSRHLCAPTFSVLNGPSETISSTSRVAGDTVRSKTYLLLPQLPFHFTLRTALLDLLKILSFHSISLFVLLSLIFILTSWGFIPFTLRAASLSSQGCRQRTRGDSGSWSPSSTSLRSTRRVTDTHYSLLECAIQSRSSENIPPRLGERRYCHPGKLGKMGNRRHRQVARLPGAEQNPSIQEANLEDV